jgi:PAS domain S-box-containing protein
VKYWIASIVFTIVMNVVLACVVYFRNRYRIPNRRFPIFVGNLMAWDACVLGIMVARDQATINWLLRWISIICAFLPATFFFFAIGFTIPSHADERLSSRKYEWFISFALALLNFYLALRPDFILSINLRPDLANTFPGPDVRYGWPFLPFAGIIIYSMTAGLRSLYRTMRGVTGAMRTEIQYIFLAFIAGTIFALSTAVIPPLFGNTIPCRFGPFSSIIMNAIIAYAIARYRILDISFVLEKTVVFSIVTACLFAGYLISVWFVSRVIGIFVQGATFAPVLISCFLVAIAFSPLKELVQKWVKQKMFSDRHNIEDVLLQMRGFLGASLHVEDSFSLLLEMLHFELKISKKVLVLIENPESFGIRALMAIGGISGCSVKENPHSAILALMKTEKVPCYREELIRFSGRQEIRAVVEELDHHGFEAAIPIVVRETLVGCMLLTAKEHNIPFTEKDKRILDALALYFGIFLENSQLYTTLRESRSYQASLLATLPSGVIAADRVGRVIVFNREAERIVGVPRERVLDRNFQDVLPPEFQEMFQLLLTEKEEIRNSELRLSANGSTIPLRVSGIRFHNEDGSLLGVQMIFSDISQIKLLQEQVLRNEKLASLGVLAAGIAHEIKNPLVALKTFSQLMPEKYEDREFRENYVKVVIPEIERINKLVEQLLLFARPRPAHFQRSNLIEILDSTLLLITTQGAFRSIRLEKEFPSAPVNIVADPEKLKQAFLNVLLNSAEAMTGEGGIIVVRVSSGKDIVKVEIKDNGSGIPEENLDRIFDPFFTTKPEGTGLGLSIVNEIVAQNNGRIFVESSPGDGTSVTIELPRIREGNDETYYADC